MGMVGSVFRPSVRVASSLRRHRMQLLMVTDVVAIVAGYAVLAPLRYGSATVPWQQVLWVCGVSIAVHLGLCWRLKLYRGRALIASSEETVLLGAVAIVTAAAASVANVLVGLQMLARTVPYGAAVTALAVMILARATWRRYALRA